MIKYNNTNNASTTLTAGISASSTTLIVENGDILPAVPFLLTLEHFDNEKVTVREIVKCIAKVGTILTIQRGAGTCVQDDTATPKAQNNTPHSFSVGDCASIYWTSEQVQDIQNEIEKKLDIDDFQAGTYVYGATSTETDAYSITIPGNLTSYAVGQVFRFMADVDNEGNATLNINGLGAVEIRKNHDKILDNGDIEAGQIVEVAYDGTYFQMDSQVATVVDLGNIDSLKMSGVVGELYTLDDELYLQDVSEDLDTSEGVTVINVGYDKEETHIQRIANGISGNSVSLYIAKVGSPVTNFNVEIRKGIYAEADGRAYRTGDSTQILASKSISYSSFTTDFQKITITFDDDIELQRGELIDIVCYQSGISDEKIKSTTNYFVLGGYVNQWGEGNSVNYVDNGTITQDVTIPYCSGDFVYNILFSKNDYTGKNKNGKKMNIFYVDNKYYGAPTNWGDVTLKTYTNNTGDIVTFLFKGGFRGSQYANIQYKIDSGSWITFGHANDGEVELSQSLNNNSVLSIRVNCSTSYKWAIDYLYEGISGLFSIEKEMPIQGMPGAIVPVGNETTIITEGIVNGQWYSQHTREQRVISEQKYRIDLLNSRGSYTFEKDGIYTLSWSSTDHITTVNFNGTTLDIGDATEVIIYDGRRGDKVDVFGGYPNTRAHVYITYLSRHIYIPTS